MLNQIENIRNKTITNNFSLVKCFLKDKFYDQRQAERRAEKLGLRAYKCEVPYCFAWHLSSKPEENFLEYNEDEINENRNIGYP